MSDVEPTPADKLGDCLDRMIAVQVQAYPDSWPLAERIEMAERHLFGEREAA